MTGNMNVRSSVRVGRGTHAGTSKEASARATDNKELGRAQWEPRESSGLGP